MNSSLISGEVPSTYLAQIVAERFVAPGPAPGSACMRTVESAEADASEHPLPENAHLFTC